MDSDERITRQSYDTDTALGKAFCRWVLPFYHSCRRQRLHMKELFKCRREDEADVVGELLEKNWENELSRKEPKFSNAFIKTFGPIFLVPFVLFLVDDCIVKVGQPVLLGIVVRYFSGTKHDNFDTTCAAAAGLCLLIFIGISCHHPAINMVMRISMKAKVAWSALVYKKCLRLNRASLGGTTVGQIINLMTNDIRRFEEFSIVCCYLIIVPIQVLLFIWVSWKYLGAACLATFFGLLLFVPTLALIGRRVTKIRSETSTLTDNRVSLMNEIIRGIRVIKLYAWEKHFSNLAHEARKQEMIKVKSWSIIKAITLSLSFVSARLVMFLSFVTYVLMGGDLSVETIFVSIALFERLRYSLTWMFPQAVSGAAEILVSCRRIQQFLLLDEIKAIEAKSIGCESSRKSIIIKNLNANVNNSSSNHEFALKNISFEAQSGELVAIVGPIGSGKSSLLLSLLGETNSTKADKFIVNGSMAYVSQESFCFNATIRQNILFGQPYDECLYKKILKVCALEEDIKQLEYYDQTLVGERGITLSGGQKARVNLARSLYQNCDIYLLDDPLSAVDVSVAKHIFENCILDYLRNKTVVLVTHQIQFLRSATNVLYINDGQQKAYGSLDRLLNAGINFISIMNEQSSSKNNYNDAIQNDDNERDNSCVDKHLFGNRMECKNCELKVEDELNDCGDLSVQLYVDYFSSGSSFFLCFLTVASIVGTQFLYHFSDYWLSFWNNVETDKLRNITTYAIISVFLFMFATLRSVTFYQLCLNAAETFHNRVLDSMLCAPINTFETIPIGRILNRFTRDISIIDDTLPNVLFDLNLACVQVIGILVMVVTVSYSHMILPALLFAFSLFMVRKLFVKPLHVMRRYEAITRSPIYSHLSTTIDGLTTVRAFGAQQIFLNQYYKYQNDHTSCYYLQGCTARLFGFALDYIGFFYIVVVVTTLLVYDDQISGKSVGLVFSSIILLTGITQWAVKRSVDTEIYMNSVERLRSYSYLSKEQNTESLVKPPENWPITGDILIRNLSMKYPNTNRLVLNRVNLKMTSGEKVGIVGRTGAGKSSLINALFGLCKSTGDIIIDGVDIKTLNLCDVRRKLSIIPQDPIAFSGSLRRNLDPFDEHFTQDLWDALKEVQLKELVELLPQQLDSIVSGADFNFSVGQRQLICLARALLRKNRVIVLDEATANVDHETDALIQKSIRHKFCDCTVIIVAHRIDTVIDCDRILVMDDGMIVDNDSPYLLLQREDSYFSKLVRNTGPIMASHLRNSAANAYNARNNSLSHLENSFIKDDNILRARIRNVY